MIEWVQSATPLTAGFFSSTLFSGFVGAVIGGLLTAISAWLVQKKSNQDAVDRMAAGELAKQVDSMRDLLDGHVSPDFTHEGGGSIDPIPHGFDDEFKRISMRMAVWVADKGDFRDAMEELHRTLYHPGRVTARLGVEDHFDGQYREYISVVVQEFEQFISSVRSTLLSLPLEGVSGFTASISSATTKYREAAESARLSWSTGSYSSHDWPKPEVEARVKWGS